ncbi:MAG: hypothetical protein JWN85_1059 [Gammaproteobacteria bacterium]|jgi:hypothetical protein|nr:hypothetical protein [Gammaproteobacteria bacterium]
MRDELPSELLQLELFRGEFSIDCVERPIERTRQLIPGWPQFSLRGDFAVSLRSLASARCRRLLSCSGAPSGQVARLQRTRDRYSDIAAHERFAEHVDDPRGLRAFGQLRTAVPAHEYD